ncbi:hypothetical protein O7634_07240 [Micromonospora sp. WMMD1120]|uniref:hypothetical protein n=1 Tax=Micromonospora sp. WMMD1120 TaxID=3016106 RepID=UPI00241748BF|nr:hypothetical protein [Micromonospora sp. WMMD1120]MDG4806550.1 hypothetical protein [Micromonospora sp. WMMD1120]
MDATDVTPDQAERRHRRGRLMLALALPTAVVAALAVGVATGGRNSGIFDGDPPVWASNLGRVLILLGVLIEAAAIVWAVRTGRYRMSRRSPLLTVGPSHRRRLERQVRRGTPEPDEDRALLVETARQAVGQRWFAVLIAGLAVVSVGQVLVGFAPFHAVIGGVLVVVWTVLIVLVLRGARRGEAFLRANPDLGGR